MTWEHYDDLPFEVFCTDNKGEKHLLRRHSVESEAINSVNVQNRSGGYAAEYHDWRTLPKEKTILERLKDPAEVAAMTAESIASVKESMARMKVEKTEKKPCPFCGSINVYHRMTPLGQAIACRNCQAIGPCCKVPTGNTELATWMLWNERHVPNPREVKCMLCNDSGTADGCVACHKVDPYLRAYQGSLVNDDNGDPNS